MTTSEMQAVLMTGYDSIDRMELLRVSRPVPAAREVLVKVHAAAINDWEWGLLHAPRVVR